MTQPVLPAASAALDALNAPSARRVSNSFQALDQGDFLRLLTVQLQQQDPLAPVDNKDMLAQMAQFSALAGTTETNARLGEIAGKIDALVHAQEQSLAAQRAALGASSQPPANPAA